MRLKPFILPKKANGSFLLKILRGLFIFADYEIYNEKSSFL